MIASSVWPEPAIFAWACSIHRAVGVLHATAKGWNRIYSKDGGAISGDSHHISRPANRNAGTSQNPMGPAIPTPIHASLAQGVQMTGCPQIYFVFGNRRSGKNLLPEIVPRQNLQFVIDLDDRDDPARGGNYNLVTRDNG